MKILLKGFEQQQILKFAKEMHFPALWSRTKILQLSKSYICYSPAKVGLYWEKLCPKSWASDGTQDRGHSFSQYRPTLAGE